MSIEQKRRGPRTPGGPIGAWVSWTLIVLVSVLLGLSQAGVFHRKERGSEAPASRVVEEATAAAAGDTAPDTPHAAEPEPADAPEETPADEADAETESGAMFAVVARSIVGASAEERPNAMRNIDTVAQTDVDRVRLAVLTGYVRGPAEAQERLGKLASAPGLSEGLRRDIATLQRLYATGRAAVDDAEDARMRERHGWFWQLATATLTDAGSEARVTLEKEARITYRIASGFTLLILAMLLGSFGLFVTAIVLVSTGKVRRRYMPPEPGGSAYLETFALFLLAFTLLSFGLGLAAAYGAEPVRRLAEPAMHVLRWVLLAVVAWPLVYRARWAEVRTAIGWTAPRGFLREVGCGLAGYVAGLPLVAGAVMVTLGLVALQKRLYGQAAMPTHPLPEMLAQAGPVELAVLVILATLWAPIVEETFFRGALYHHLRGRVHWSVAGLVSGLIFAAIHPQGMLAIPPLLAIAMVLGMLREWRGSLIASMTAHAVNNAIVTVFVIVAIKAG